MASSPVLLVHRSAVGAFFSIAAGAVHLAAYGAHHDQGLLGWLIGLTGLAQLSIGIAVLLTPQRRCLIAGATCNAIAVVAWSLSRTTGLPIPGNNGAAQPIGAQDLAAAVLGLGAVATLSSALARREDEETRFGPVAAIAVASLALMGVASPHHHGVIDQSVPILEAGRLSGRLPTEEAIALLGLSARQVLPGAAAHSHDHGPGHGAGFGPPPPPEPLDRGEQAQFEDQWARASAAAGRLATLEDAERAGYTQASTEAAGIGAHWVKWSLVDHPFDPGAPSMVLLKGMRNGEAPELVGFSYLVASPDIPEGFAGQNDVWHQHHGMCFIDGWLRSEGIDRREDCEDTWIDGSDLWMLHAWSAPEWPNRWGPFADMHPSLCGVKPLTPDILRCDPNTG